MQSGTSDVKRRSIAERGSRAAEGMAGLAKGLAIIEAFETSGGRLTVSDAARYAGVTRATARRCLLTLVDLNYVAHDGKFFTPLPRLIRLGAAYVQGAPLAQRAQALLASARDALGESVSLAVWSEGESVFVARAEATHIVSTGVRVGARLPAYCSATGRVLLGALPEQKLRAALGSVQLDKHTPKTIVDVDALADAVRRARIDGYAISDEELTLGMRSLAVAVRDGNGRTIAAMSASVASARVALAEFIERALPVLREHARLLEDMLVLSGSPPTIGEAPRD